MTMEYAVIIERGGNNLSAYVPDLPGCVATGRDEADVLKNITEAIRFHIEGMREDGDAVPPPQSVARQIKV